MSKRKAPRPKVPAAPVLAEVKDAHVGARPRPVALLMLIALAAVGTGAALLWRKPAATPPQVQEPLSQLRAAANTCRRAPPFASELGFGPGMSLSTTERDLRGLALVEYGPKGRIKQWQHPSWQQTGNLAALTIDRSGNVYVVPAPRVDLQINPPELQNRLYKVDAQSAEMTLLLEFPTAKPVSSRNPFAGLGLSYDCDLDSLYLSSVAGSDAHTQRGMIFRIALEPQPQIATQFSGFDAFGISAMQSATGKVLLMGSARSGELYFLKIGADGGWQGLPQRFASIAGLGPDGNERARRIDLEPDGSLRVSGAKFAYNLAQPSAQGQATHYRFVWDDAAAAAPNGIQQSAGAYRFADWQSVGR